MKLKATFEILSFVSNYCSISDNVRLVKCSDNWAILQKLINSN